MVGSVLLELRLLALIGANQVAPEWQPGASDLGQLAGAGRFATTLGSGQYFKSLDSLSTRGFVPPYRPAGTPSCWYSVLSSSLRHLMRAGLVPESLLGPAPWSRAVSRGQSNNRTYERLEDVLLSHSLSSGRRTAIATCYGSRRPSFGRSKHFSVALHPLSMLLWTQ